MSVLTARDRETIRAALLARLAARHHAAGSRLDTREPGDAWQTTAALAALLAALEAQAESAVMQILPDRATGTLLDAHGATPELARDAGETDQEFQARLLSWWQLRLLDGSPAAWKAKCEQSAFVNDCFVYPRLRPGTTNTFTLGCTILVCRGEAPGDSPTNTFVLSGPAEAHVEAFLDGTENAEGVVGGPGSDEQRPLCAVDGNVIVETISTTKQNVEIQVEAAVTHPFPWSGSHAIVASTDTTITIAGDHHDLAGLPVLANVGDTLYRGGYYAVQVTTAVFGGVNTVLTLAETLAAAPAGTIYPAPPFWSALRTAIFALFDSLTPGDSATPSRWPPVTGELPTVLRRAAIIRAALSAPGILRVTSIPLPAANVTPTTKAQLVTGTILVTSA